MNTTATSTSYDWKTHTPFPEPTWELEGVECNNKIYLIGGISNAWGAKSGWIPNRMVYEFNPATDQWTRKVNVPDVMHHMAVTEYNGDLYCFGGYRTPNTGPDDWLPVANAMKYSPTKDSWTEIAPLPFARGAASATTLNGEIYIAGGSYACRRKNESEAKPLAPHTSTNELLAYNPITNSYTTCAPMLTARNHHVLEALNGKLYAMGGRVGSSNAFTFTNKIDLVEEYDPTDDTWWPKSKMLAAHGGMLSCIHNGAIYVSGGDAIKMIEKYDAQIDKWTVVAELPQARLGGSGGCINGRLYVMTGHLRTPTGSQPVGDNISLDISNC